MIEIFINDGHELGSIITFVDEEFCEASLEKDRVSSLFFDCGVEMNLPISDSHRNISFSDVGSRIHTTEQTEVSMATDRLFISRHMCE